ncbi:MAG: UTP--glucose-1-phosphate uridylyltransferase GalU [Bdellovibrionales bacterium]|nr:UTP--glucose-1-phosphate uridylyltransferase GalU [Bdellovibrionales bacterium]
MPNTVKIAVIPTAGLGTRFLPATKAIPKELFPIIDRPILLYIVEEAVRSGIENIVLVNGRGKTAIEDFFDTSYELEDRLVKTRKDNWYEEIQRIKSLANIISIRQKKAEGLGHAVLASQPVIGKAPFAVLLGDELMVNSQTETPAIGQLINNFTETGISTVAVMEIEKSETEKYGIIGHSGQFQGKFKVDFVVEKPSPEHAPSSLALPGRYVFSPSIFSLLQNLSPGKGGEIQLTDAMTNLAKSEGLFAMKVHAQRYDAGDKLGYLKANIELGLKHNEIGESLRDYLIGLAKKLSS